MLAGRKGGRNAGVARRRESLETIRRMTNAMTNIEAFLLGRKYGKTDNANARVSARREGYAEGFEAGYQAALRQQHARRLA